LSGGGGGGGEMAVQAAALPPQTDSLNSNGRADHTRSIRVVAACNLGVAA